MGGPVIIVNVIQEIAIKKRNSLRIALEIFNVSFGPFLVPRTF